jgi:hypothetical protein
MLGRKSTDSTTYHPRVGARAAAIEMLLELSNTQTWTQGFTLSIERGTVAISLLDRASVRNHQPHP